MAGKQYDDSNPAGSMKPTSNHNSATMPTRTSLLYLIEILHQTTTSGIELTDILHYISKLSSLKSPNSHFDEVDLMYFSMSKNKANIRKISKKTPVAEVYPVWPVRPSPRNS